MSNRQISVRYQRQLNVYSIVAGDGAVVIQHRFSSDQLEEASNAFDFYVDQFAVALDAELVNDVRAAFLSVSKSLASRQRKVAAQDERVTPTLPLLRRLFNRGISSGSADACV